MASIATVAPTTKPRTTGTRPAWQSAWLEIRPAPGTQDFAPACSNWNCRRGEADATRGASPAAFPAPSGAQQGITFSASSPLAAEMKSLSLTVGRGPTTVVAGEALRGRDGAATKAAAITAAGSALRTRAPDRQNRRDEPLMAVANTNSRRGLSKNAP